MAKQPIDLTVLGGEMVRMGHTANAAAAAATQIRTNATSYEPVDNPGLSRLMAERDAILAQAATNVDRREKLSAAARKGWETRRRMAALNTFITHTDEFHARVRQLAEQREIWRQQDAALKAKKTLFQRLAVRLLGMIGVR